MKRKTFLKIIIFLIAILFSVPAILPLLHPGVFMSDDSTWMIIRLTDFHRSLRDGQFPVRWAGRLSSEYGYPVFHFSYPLFLYIGEVFKLIGFTFVNSIKMVFGLSLILSAVSCYFWLSGHFKKFAAVIGAFVYLYVPYHISDVYRRGSIGEVLAMVFVPIVLLGLDHLKKDVHSRSAVFLVGLGLAALITAHNILSMLAFPFLLVYFLILIIFSDQKVKLFLKGSLLFLFGLGLSAFFWLPAIIETKYTIFGLTKVTVFSEHFVPFLHLIFPFSTSSNVPTVSVFSFLLVIIGGVVLFKDKNFEKRIMGLYFVITFVFSVFLVTIYSYPLWKILVFLQLVQFPWRLLALTLIPLSYFGAYLVNRFTGKVRLGFGILMLAALFFTVYPYLTPPGYFYEPEGFYTTNEHNTTIGNEYISKWAVDQPVVRPKEKVEVTKGEGKIDLIENYSNRTIFSINATEKSFVRVNTTYFPWWKVYIDGKESEIIYQNVHGLIEFWVDKGEHNVAVRLVGTPLWHISDTISLISFIILFLYFVFRKQRVVKLLELLRRRNV